MDEYLTAAEALAHFGVREFQLRPLRKANRAIRSGFFQWRYAKRDILRLALIGELQLEGVADIYPITQFVYAVLIQAIDRDEREIVFEPQPEFLKVRFASGDEPSSSFEGWDKDVRYPPPKEKAVAIIARLKDQADLALDVCDRVQTGRFGLRHQNKAWDCLVTVEPTHFGERVRVEFRPGLPRSQRVQ